MTKFYLTTAIDYVNGAPHIGHAYEKIQTDVLARHFRQRYDDVYFLTGTDEHGIKIQKTSASMGITPKELCDANANKFKECWQGLDISYNQFIRTTDEQHEKIVQKIFQKLQENGDIYKHSYTGLYCAGCESFLNPRDLTEDGLCPDHLKKPEEIKEENYFFKLSKYKDRIIEHIKTHPEFIQPEFRANEVLNQLEHIEDISVSRSKDSVSWGVPVLGDDSQTIYVWIDALSNYITALGYDPINPSEKFKTYWPADVQVIGKDILKFHAIYWPAFLMALDLPLPKTIFAHGWITIDETKMSKSLGNVIAPKDVLEHFELTQPDAFRYFMMTAAPAGRDGNYSDQDFKEKVNADLANNIGNLLNRTLNMQVKYFDGEIKPEFITSYDDEIAKEAVKTVEAVKARFDKFEVAEAAAEIVNFANTVNKYVNDTAPWGLAKEGKMDECAKVLYNVLESMRFIATMLAPYCPNIAQDVYQQLNRTETAAQTKLDSLKWGDIPAGKITEKEKIKPVFLRVDSEIAGAAKKA